MRFEQGRHFRTGLVRTAVRRPYSQSPKRVYGRSTKRLVSLFAESVKPALRHRQ